VNLEFSVNPCLKRETWGTLVFRLIEKASNWSEGAVMPDEDRAIRKELMEFLSGGNAHASIDDAVKDFPPSLYAKKPAGAPHTAWQLLEHIRITLDDLLEFCRNPDYRAPKWPDGYWPKKDTPESAEAWNTSVKALKRDSQEFEKLLKSNDVDLTAKIPWGEGQTILREILLAGDHTSYHVGQLIMLRKQLGAWKE
jgi:uncharacterized damage-inducible protein DinB